MSVRGGVYCIGGGVVALNASYGGRCDVMGIEVMLLVFVAVFHSVWTSWNEVQYWRFELTVGESASTTLYYTRVGGTVVR